MKIYILERINKAYCSVLGVFSSMEKASEAALKACHGATDGVKDCIPQHCELMVEEATLDKIISSRLEEKA